MARLTALLLLVVAGTAAAATAAAAASNTYATARVGAVEPAEAEFVNCTHKVLVVMSSVGSIELQNGINHTIGFFLDELMIPLTALLNAGWEPTFVNPKGNRPPMDPHSDQAYYFDPINPIRAAMLYKEAKDTLEGLTGLNAPIPFVNMTNDRLDELNFDMVFIPGGHPPMVDLYQDPELGRILVHFFDQGKPIGAICHGPTALLSAGLARQPWVFAGRHMTVFSTAGEKINEKNWGGKLPFYPEDKLSAAGAILNMRGPAPYMPNSVRDLSYNSSLVTAQNPFSAPDMAAMVTDELLARCGPIY